MTDELERHRLAATDGLTGALSWRQFFDIGQAEVARARRYRNPLSCLVIDIDRVPSPDDAADPAAGDLLLQNFVTVCKATVRAPDYIGRIGGKGFAIMLPETPLLGALGVAERILANLAAAAAGPTQHRLTALTSIGVVEYDDLTPSLELLLQAADSAMADARQNGSNQAVCYLDDLQLSSVSAPVN